MKTPIVEICCGSYYDCLQAEQGGCDRIELNSALFLGGLTPTISTLRLVKQQVNVPVIAMVRPRAGGFCYQPEEFAVMLEECHALLENGADGIAFGILKENRWIDEVRNAQIIALIKEYRKEVVFHRAFDCISDPYTGMETLIRLGVDRVLTSGMKEKAWDGRSLITQLQDRYGEQIEILAGSGINSENACKLIHNTKIYQVHSSCKSWQKDSTTKVANQVSYGYAAVPYEECYEVVSKALVKELVKSVKG